MLQVGREKRTAWWAADRTHGSSASVGLWMICRLVLDGFEAMTLPCRGEKALALFGHEEDAELFLRSLEAESTDDGWRFRESGRGEIASVLYGPSANPKRVVLDPLPSMVDEGTVALASMDRTSSMASLLARGGAGGWSSPRKYVNASLPRRASVAKSSALRWPDQVGHNPDDLSVGTNAETE